MSPVARIDPLLWLVLMGSVGLLLPHLPLAAVGMVAAALLWRRVHEVRGLPLPHRGLLTLFAVLGGAYVLFHFHAFWGRDAGVTLLIIAAGLKLLETRDERDQYGVLLLSFFLLVSVLLFDQAIWIFLLVGLLFWLLVGAWIGVSQPVSPPIGARMRDGGTLILTGLPFALILFALFPRPPGGLWGVQQPGGAAQTGLSEQMRPGEFDQLGRNPAPAFRVRFEDEVLPPETRYWRVYVMSRLDPDNPEGWTADPPAGTPGLEWVEDSQVRYQVTLEPTGNRTLPALPAAIEAPGRSRIDGNLLIQRPRTVDDRLRYTVTSALEYRLDADGLPAATRERNLQTADLNPLLTDLATEWRDLPPTARVAEALQYFRDNDFRYTLSPGRRDGADRADAFLFDTREGYCADYADAFTRLMRAAGVPARVVTGYQGGETGDDFLVVRQADAHAWSEVWLEGKGWQRVDPTAVVAPERIETGLAESMANDPSLSGVIRRDENDWGRRAQLLVEQMDNRWNQYVLGYDGRIQLNLLAGMGVGGMPPLALALLALALAVVTWVGVLWALARRAERKAAGSLTDYLWQRLQDRLARLGIERDSRESEQAFLERAARARPRDADDLRRIANQLQSSRYARRATRRQEELLQTRLKNLLRRLWLQRRASGRHD
ncbi:transglutaminaseTgpA domain-containing protein [Guyparkeria sp.]|uniref:transglutaminase family protein n=1 Tax=Guyparkeria sp. TaxID=2035736 RepID=UPI0035613D77